MIYKFSLPGFFKTHKLTTVIILALVTVLIITQFDALLPILSQRTRLQENKLSPTSSKVTPNQTTEQEAEKITHFNLTMEKIENGFFVNNETFLIKDGIGEKLIEVSPENQRILTRIIRGRSEQPTAYLYTVQEPIFNSTGASGNPYYDHSKWGGGKQCENCSGQLGTIWEKEVSPNSDAGFLNDGKEVILLFRGDPQSSPNSNTDEILYEVNATKIKLDGYNTFKEQNVLREPAFLPAGGLSINSVSPDQLFVFFQISPELGLNYQYLLDTTTGKLIDLGKLTVPIISDQNFQPRWNYFDNTLIYFTTIREPEDVTEEPLIQGKITYNPISKKEISREEIVVD